MSAKTRPKYYERIPQSKLDAMITPRPDPRPVLHNDVDYDTLRPEEKVKAFCSDIREMLSRYESDKIRFDELEKEMQDLLHYIEMAENKNANVGFKLYKRLAEVRRERRACKNELDLLQPIHDNFKSDLLNSLSRIQGICTAVKQQIDGRCYTVRTDILDDFVK